MLLMCIVLHMGLKRLRHRVGDGLDAVRAEANGAGAADALEMLDQQLHLLAVVAIPEEQRADAAERFRHGEHVRASFADIQEDFSRRAVQVVDRDVRHAEWRVDLIGSATQNLRAFLVLLVDDAAGRLYGRRSRCCSWSRRGRLRRSCFLSLGRRFSRFLQ
ncbi:hypothetical protein D3C71_1629990 [compost metagenome]